MDGLWANLSVVEIDAVVTTLAADLLIDHAIRAGDAIQLASGLTLAAGSTHDVTFACWDRRLWAAAASFGFVMVPEALV